MPKAKKKPPAPIRTWTLDGWTLSRPELHRSRYHPLPWHRLQAWSLLESS